jgi:hypothetical protein
VSNQKMWKTKDGRKVRICDMGESHLENTIALLRRAHARYVAEATADYPMFQGEMAQFYAEQEWESAVSSAPEDTYPILIDMREELFRRRNKESA